MSWTVGSAQWGVWEGQHWNPYAALLRTDFSEKPNMKVWRDLVYNQWWTRESLRTDAAGRATVRGFLGDYKITVAGQDIATTLSKTGQIVTVTLPRPAE